MTQIRYAHLLHDEGIRCMQVAHHMQTRMRCFDAQNMRYGIDACIVLHGVRVVD